jgi:hypothetical protein
VEVDRFAVDSKGYLVLLSVVADGMRIKQVRAMLARSKIRTHVSIEGVKYCFPRTPEKAYNSEALNRNGKTIAPSEAGYDSFTQKLDYGMGHALFLSNAVGFMPVMDEVSLWNELRSERFTTPIIREWTPYIMDRLTSLGLLKWCRCYRASSATLECETPQLDEIVSYGLKSGLIAIPNPDHKDAEFSEVQPRALEFATR